MNGRVYLRVPVRDRPTVQALGARYDRGAHRWYVPRYVSVDAFARWLPARPAVIEHGDGTRSTATANLVVPKIVAYEDPVNRTTWKTRRVRVPGRG
ncbi:hypothetical protein SBC1_31350 [Caballeronia sp. SBC1]|uniref:DUF5710 domain-containing protein n=1 Tax=Caballeronia sp. SBC1 TaxID=2705548 RepID=UPI00140ADA6D|nr:DUF5710 domain-containing protein [Caballeronia sp. SBC1]QIN63111.1 hypothetical protein SBC1_31350 [Caballeronia sp. SBC1]